MLLWRSEIEIPPSLFLLKPGGVWVYGPKGYIKCEVRGNEIYYSLTLPKPPSPDMEIRVLGSPTLKGGDVVPNEGWWKP